MINYFSKLKFNKSILLYLGFLVFIPFVVIANNLDTQNFMWDYDGVLYNYIYENISIGNVPFRDFFIEYPPLATYLIAFPALIVNLFTDTFTLGVVGFNNSILGFICIVLGLFHYVSHKFSLLKSHQNNFLLWISVYASLIISNQVFFGRFDYIPALLSSFGLLAYLKYLENKQTKFFILGISLVTFGVFIKIYPLLFLILITIFEIIIKRYRNLKWISLVFVLGIGFNMYFYSIGSVNFVNFLQYQTNSRDLEIGSIMAGFIFVLDYLKLIPKEQILFQNSAAELGGVTAKILAKFSLPMIVGSVVWSVWFLVDLLRDKIKSFSIPQLQEIFVLSCFVLLGFFLIFNKVFSPQYLTWLYLTLPLLTFVDFRKYKNYLVWFLVSPVIISYLTFFIFPYNWKSLMLGKIDIIYVLNVRNLILIILVCTFVKMLYTKCTTSTNLQDYTETEILKEKVTDQTATET